MTLKHIHGHHHWPIVHFVFARRAIGKLYRIEARRRLRKITDTARMLKRHPITNGRIYLAGGEAMLKYDRFGVGHTISTTSRKT